MEGKPAADEVDRIVEAWRRERPDLDAAPLEVLSRVSRLARHLDLARRKAFGHSGLEPWEFDVLAALRRSGPPYRLTPGELLRQTLVTSGTMTNRIDRLEGRGFVTRAASPTDRRAVHVTLTDSGREVVDGALSMLLQDERALLASLDSREQALLAKSLRALLADFER